MVTAITNEQAAFRGPLHGSSVYDDASGHANLASLCQVSFVACLLSVDEHLFPEDADPRAYVEAEGPDSWQPFVCIGTQFCRGTDVSTGLL